MEKELILLCINSSKFQAELDLETRGYEDQATNVESRKCALIATASEKMYDFSVFEKFKISMVRSVMPHKFDLKSLNTRNLINAEFLSHLWQDTNI